MFARNLPVELRNHGHIRRMMHGNHDGTRKLFCFDALKRSGKKIQLRIGEILIGLLGALLAGNNAGVLKAVAVEAENADERGFECEVDCRAKL